LILTKILGALWAVRDRGGSVGDKIRLPAVRPTQGSKLKRDEEGMEEEGGMVEYNIGRSEVGKCPSSPSLQCRSGPCYSTNPLATPQGLATVGVLGVSNDESNLFVKLKKEHNLAKAVKLDDAKVDIHSWGCRVCRGEPTGEQVRALNKLRKFSLRRYRIGMWRDVRGYMTGKYEAMDHSVLRNTGRIRTREEWIEARMKWRLMNAKGWLEQAWTNTERVREGKKAKKAEALEQEIEAMREILTRTAENNWF
jgi:hypothetical protein